MDQKLAHRAGQPPAETRSAWRLYQPVIWLCAVGSVVAWAPQARDVDWAVVAMLVAIGVVSDFTAVRIKQGMRVSTAHFAAPFAIVAAGAFGGLVTAFAVLLGRPLMHRKDWNTFDVAVNIVSASIAALVWSALSDMGEGLMSAVIVVTVFALVRSAINFGWTLEAGSKGIIIPPVSAQISKLMLANAVLFAPAVALYIAHGAATAESIALLALPFVATQFTTRAYGRESRLNAELERTNLDLTESLVNALDARDPYSAGHSVAVAVYARDIAQEIGLKPDDVRRLYLAGLLHDIGKIAVPDAVLCKPAALTDEEFDEIKKHPVVGEQILAPSRNLSHILPSVRGHHERLDGRGYPDGLVGEQIPLDARIIAVADAYNAMTSTRPYRDAMTPEVACNILVQNQGMQHDAYLVGAFLRVLEQHDDQYAIARGHDFATSQAMVELLGNPRLLRSASEDDRAA